MSTKDTKAKFAAIRSNAALVAQSQTDATFPFDEYKDPFLADWKRVREQIAHEDELIHQRTTWLITINAFLFGGFFLSQKGDAVDEFKTLADYFSWLIPLVGVALSWAAQVGIEAAMRQVKLISNWWIQRKRMDPRNYSIDPDDANNVRHPQLIGLASGKWLDHDFMISKTIPWGLIVSWILVLAGIVRESIVMEWSLSLPVWAWAIVLILLFALLRWGVAQRMNPDE